MEFSFARNRIQNTTFYAPSSDGAQPAYTIKTTRGPFWFPHKTVIEYVGDSDAEKRHVAAVILWNWPSQKRSHIYINGKLMSLIEFMPFGSGFMKWGFVFISHDCQYWLHLSCSSDSYVKLGENIHMWRSIDFEPQVGDHSLPSVSPQLLIILYSYTMRQVDELSHTLRNLSSWNFLSRSPRQAYLLYQKSPMTQHFVI